MAILWSVLLICLYTDLKERKIYNKVVVPGALAGLVVNVALSGWSGLTSSLLGFLVGLGIFLIPFALGGIGAGDVKLFGSIGAIMGPAFAFYAALSTAIAGGVIAVGILVKQGRLQNVLKRIWSIFISIILFRQYRSLTTLDHAEYHESFPYGVAIAIGVLLAMFVR